MFLAGLPTPVGGGWLPKEVATLVAGWSPEDLAAAAQAQAAWQAHQETLDLRIRDLSTPITPDELMSALRVMRSLFNWYTNPDVSLAGAMYWAGLLLDITHAAEDRGESAPVPLPHLWFSRGELDMIEHGDEASEHIVPGTVDTPRLDAPGASASLWERRTLAAMPQGSPSISQPPDPRDYDEEYDEDDEDDEAGYA